MCLYIPCCTPSWSCSGTQVCLLYQTVSSMGVRNHVCLGNCCILSTEYKVDIHGGGNGNPLQYSCLENPMDSGAWQATVHRVVELDTSEQLTLSLSQNFRLFFPSSLARRSSSRCVQFAFLSDLNKKRKSYKWDKIKTIIMPRGKKNQLHFP